MSRLIDFAGIYRGVIGKKLPSDSTLNNMRKSELIELLHIAEHNYKVLSEFYSIAVDHSKCNSCSLGKNAYNVDHAVEEMEELRAHYVDACCMCSGSNCGKCNITEFISELERLIELLENGGTKNEM